MTIFQCFSLALAWPSAQGEFSALIIKGGPNSSVHTLSLGVTILLHEHCRTHHQNLTLKKQRKHFFRPPTMRVCIFAMLTLATVIGEETKFFSRVQFVLWISTLGEVPSALGLWQLPTSGLIIGSQGIACQLYLDMGLRECIPWM
ncbi:uncharacterized protein F5147DRAFT_176831 [Suillus discolor]|uniref:Uncharacterized protein n=1 Tax=Suillus discolor TaxID=1912936 RepID=A0A9P7F754_9AGAM|nr:uncharacterized protein F5147DRAFT_176831 [Suillus discolor]KAG2107887.1 hypothetical protein F5147DRAFT_176831 [Suillus discolor]